MNRGWDWNWVLELDEDWGYERGGQRTLQKKPQRARSMPVLLKEG